MTIALMLLLKIVLVAQTKLQAYIFDLSLHTGIFPNTLKLLI